MLLEDFVLMDKLRCRDLEPKYRRSMFLCRKRSAHKLHLQKLVAYGLQEAD